MKTIDEISAPLLENLEDTVESGNKWYGSKHEVVNKAPNSTKGTFGEKFTSNRNEAIFFDQSIRHRSVTQTDTDLRINININYEYPNSPSTE